MRSVVVVGASLAGLRTAEGLRREGYGGRLFVVGEEEYPPYDRPPLSKGFLGSDVAHDGLRLRQSDELQAEWLLQRSVRRVDPRMQTVELSDGRSLRYDGLVVASGASPRRLPGIDLTLPGVHELRTYDDACSLREDLARAPRVVIIGGGFIGAELASTCRQLGLEVTIVTDVPLLANALGTLATAASARARSHGVRVVEPALVIGVAGRDRVTGVELADGRQHRRRRGGRRDRRRPPDRLAGGLGGDPGRWCRL